MSEPSIAREMRANRHHLDEDSASRLLLGLVHPDDAPPGYGAVAGLLNSAAQLPLGAVDEDAAASTVSAMVETIRNAPTPAPGIPRRKTLGKLLAGKALAAVAVVGLSASGAAAATGSLPESAQGVVSEALSKVGVDVPHPNHGKSAGHRKDDKGHKSDGKAPGDDQGKQPADKPENKGQTTSTAAHNAKDAAKAAGEKVGPAVCEAVGSNCVKDGTGTGTGDKGTGSDNGQSGRHGKSGEDHGKPEDTPAKPAPPAGSIPTGVDNSGKDVPVGKGKPVSGE